MCIFCKIVNGEIPSYKLYEDDHFLSFLDISQTTKGHALLIPKKHFDNLLYTDESLLSEMLPIASKIASAIQKITKAQGFNILTNCGEAAGQSVLHFHIHIIPRYENDNFSINFSSNSYSSDELSTLSNEIKKSLS